MASPSYAYPGDPIITMDLYRTTEQDKKIYGVGDWPE
jgi:hypothetical protein